jgi:hypothetical protein
MKYTNRESMVQLEGASSTTTCTEDTNSERAPDSELLRCQKAGREKPRCGAKGTALEKQCQSHYSIALQAPGVIVAVGCFERGGRAALAALMLDI